MSHRSVPIWSILYDPTEFQMLLNLSNRSNLIHHSRCRSNTPCPYPTRPVRSFSIKACDEAWHIRLNINVICCGPLFWPISDASRFVLWIKSGPSVKMCTWYSLIRARVWCSLIDWSVQWSLIYRIQSYPRQPLRNGSVVRRSQNRALVDWLLTLSYLLIVIHNYIPCPYNIIFHLWNSMMSRVTK